MAMQAYARPYESDSLDRLQTLVSSPYRCQLLTGEQVYACQFLFLFLGVLMSSPRGSADLKSTLEVTFFVLFCIAGLVCVLYLKKNVVRYRSVKR